MSGDGIFSDLVWGFSTPGLDYDDPVLRSVHVENVSELFSDPTFTALRYFLP